MSDKPTSEPRKSAPEERDDRLKSALKANLARRKAQLRARSVREADRTEAGRSEKNKD